jgi:SAM-dependent methyltransferase
MPALSSPSTAVFEPHRFKSTASHYLRGRLDYPAELIAAVAKRVGLDPSSSVLDLGCGPGFLAIAFRRWAGETLGIDPEPEMLAAAQRRARETGVDARFRQGSSYDLGPRLGRFRLTAMGRSFHWMDRVATLQSLDGITEPGGAVAIFRDRHLDVPETGWKSRFDELFAELRDADPDRNIDRRSGRREHPHESVLLDSPFSRLERLGAIRRLTTPVDRLLDRALSYSIASPDRLGPKRDAFIARLRAFLEREAKDGALTEVVETEALLAFRPNGS